MVGPQGLKQQFAALRTRTERFPVKVKMYILLLMSGRYQSLLSQIPQSIRQHHQPTLRVFKKMTPNQQLRILEESINHVEGCLTRRNAISPIHIYQIETTCELKGSFLSMTSWDKKTFHFDWGKLEVRIASSKRQDSLQLTNYMVRRSKGEKHAVVFEAVEPKISERLQKVSVRFKNDSICEQIFRAIRDAVMEILCGRLEQMLKEEGGFEKKEEGGGRDNCFLTHTNINAYFDCRDKLQQKLKKKRKNARMVYSEPSIKLFKSSNSKYYYLEWAMPEQCSSIQAAREATNILSSKDIPGVYHCQKLQSFSANIGANYYKIIEGQREYQMVMVVEQSQKQGRYIQLMHAIGKMGSSLHITFMALEVFLQANKYHCLISLISPPRGKQQGNALCKLMLQMIDYQSQKSKIFEQSRLMNQDSPIDIDIDNLEKIKTSHHSSVQHSSNSKEDKELSSPDQEEEEDDEQFYTIIEDEEEIEEQPMTQKLIQLLNSHHSDHMSQLLEEIQEDRLPKSSKNIPKNYLKIKPFVVPKAKGPPQILKEHFLFGDWKRLSKGGVVCINQEHINEQKKVFKTALGQLGSRFAKMKGMMNFSLPIFICKAESALATISRNFSYAPLLFENVKDFTPLELMKRVCIYQVSMAAMALSMKKPLNPILGETYQGQIDGCPIFAEQISHHPPVSYFYLVGRGFKVYGSVALHIAIRLNYILGYNDGILTMELDGGQKYDFTLPTMVLNGVLFGERSVYFEGHNYVSDQQNNLIAEIVYNYKNKGILSMNTESPDLLLGEIYQVEPIFMEKFKAAKRRLSPKKDSKSKLLRSFTGQWNNKLAMNGEVIFDFEKTLPHVLKHFDCPVASDCSFRPDVRWLLKKEVGRAQEQKDLMQERQREDKKNRNIYGKH